LDENIAITKGPLTGSLSLLSCFNHLSSVSLTSLRSGFRNGFILEPLCSNALIILVLSFQIFWMVEFIRSNSRHALASFFSFHILFLVLHYIFFRCSKPSFCSWL